MSGILLQYINHFKNHLKFKIFIENQKMTKFFIQQYNKTFNIMIRNIVFMSQIEENDKKNLISQKFKNICKQVQVNNCIPKKEMISIIDLIDSSNVIDTNKLLSLLYWCNNVTCLPVDRIKLAESLWIILTVCSMFSIYY